MSTIGNTYRIPYSSVWSGGEGGDEGVVDEELDACYSYVVGGCGREGD